MHLQHHGAQVGLLLGLEVEAVILRRATVLIDEFFAEGLLDLDEVGLVMRCRQTLDQPLELGREPVEGFVARRPQCVTAGVGGRLDDLEDGVVRGNTLEGDASR